MAVGPPGARGLRVPEVVHEEQALQRGPAQTQNPLTGVSTALGLRPEKDRAH